jgi:predicted dehydrogenase
VIPARVGIVGCGVISRRYAENAAAFPTFEIVACADLDPARAGALAAECGPAPATVDELVADPDLDVVLNLTPAAAHAAVTRAALAAGKHVYSEKPLAATADEAGELVREAERRGLRLGCAPDTFLSGAYETARTLLDEGRIGAPLAVGAAMLVGGQETWHPDPEVFFADGAGPLLDMGPYYLTAIVALLGPVRRVSGVASTRVLEREIAFGPRTGERFAASTPTHTSLVLELESGVTANLVASFEAPGQYVCDFAIYGTEGVLALPDPNAFGGPLLVRHGKGAWESVPLPPGGHDARGIGLHEMLQALEDDRPHRASGALAHHVVDIARSGLRAAAEGRSVEVVSRGPAGRAGAGGAAVR